VDVVTVVDKKMIKNEMEYDQYGNVVIYDTVDDDEDNNNHHSVDSITLSQ
jgi:hypothetical protein